MALEGHASTLDSQNKVIFNELDNFASADENIKHTLDKRAQVRDLKENMQTSLIRSEYELRAKSPSRR